MLAPAMAGTLQIDKERSRIQVDAKATGHVFTGTLTDYEAIVNGDSSSLEPDSVNLRWKFSDLKTGEEKRDKEMIKVSGMSVFPSEVEALLARHPAVLGVAVVPMPDRERGQLPLAFVQPAPGASIDVDELIAWARENMATYKVPVFQVLSELPMTTTGKVKKGDLLDEAQRLADAR